MIRWPLIIALSVMAQIASQPAQACTEEVQALMVAQRSYVQIRPDVFASRPWLYLYVPDIESRLGRGGFKTFTMWLVEGIYGKAFAEPSGPLRENEFRRIRESANVRSQPINVAYDERTRSAARISVRIIPTDPVALEVVEVKTSLLADHAVTVRICR